MPEFRRALDPDVGVQTSTFIAYDDGRPTDLILASTQDDQVLERTLNAKGEHIVGQALAAIFLFGLEPCGPSS